MLKKWFIYTPLDELIMNIIFCSFDEVIISHTTGLVQDCSISIDNALEILQFLH